METQYPFVTVESSRKVHVELDPGHRQRRQRRRALDIEVDGIKCGLGTPNSSAGSKTKAAMMEFRRRSGLVAGGVVGPKTWAGFGLA